MLEFGAIIPVLGKALATVGGFLKEALPLAGPLLDVVDRVKSTFFREKVGIEDTPISIQGDDAAASDVIQVNEIFAEYITNISKSASEIENTVIQECETMLDGILAEFKEVNEELNLFSFNNVRRKFDRTIRGLHGTFAQEISSVISLTNPECLEILRMIPCAEKDEMLEHLKQKAFQNSVDVICVTIQETTDEFIDDITYAIESRLQSVEDNAKQYLDNLDALNRSIENNSSEEIICSSEYSISLYTHYVDLLKAMEDSIMVSA